MEVNVSEALRYLGAGDRAPEELRLAMEEIAHRLTARLTPRFIYRVFSLAHEPEGVRLREADLLLTGQTAKRMLAGCGRAALLACTLGAEFDALLRAEQARDMARAAMLNACGSALVEADCDAAEREIGTRFPELFLTDRFSPGYGDLPLNLQIPLCAALDTQRRLGVYVSDACLMTPVKSVSAIIGLGEAPQPARIRGCGFCAMRETCALRKGGKTCGYETTGE